MCYPGVFSLIYRNYVLNWAEGMPDEDTLSRGLSGKFIGPSFNMSGWLKGIPGKLELYIQPIYTWLDPQP
jgi:hypothetical protein